MCVCIYRPTAVEGAGGYCSMGTLSGGRPYVISYSKCPKQKTSMLSVVCRKHTNSFCLSNLQTTVCGSSGTLGLFSLSVLNKSFQRSH